MRTLAMLMSLLISGFIFSQSFTDVSAGLPGVNRSSAAWGDYDNDGDIDLLISGDNTTAVFRNDGGSFTNINAALTRCGYGSVAWGDYDGDGDLDILISGFNGSGITKIYKNSSGSFSDINAGLPGVYHGVSTWGDYDNDGDLDVFLTGNTGSGYISRLYRNDAGSFVNTNISFPGLIYSFAKWGDYDNDGDIDLLLSGNNGSGRSTLLYKNNGGVFTSVSHGLPAVESGPFDWCDFDNDGDLDLMFTGWDGVNVVTDIYVNNNGIFSALNTGLTKMYAGSTQWGDYNNDGFPDVLVNGYSSAGFYTKIYKNNSGTFTDIAGGFPGVRWGWSRWGDFDNDGDLDFILTGDTGSGYIAKIYRNNYTDIQAPPNAPVAFSASDVSSSGFKASWSNSLGADGYFLDVATDSTFTIYSANYENFDAGNVNSFYVSDLNPQTTYFYRLRAYNETGSSENSNSVRLYTSSSGTAIYPTYVSGIWTKLDSPYYIYGDIIIPDGEKLTIEPGCEIIIMGHYRIIVQGCIDAVGQEADKIIFRAQDPETGWMGIRFIDTPNTNPKSKIGFSTITDGNANILGGTESYGGAISVQGFSNLDIFNNIFESNRAGAGSAINCYNASPKISDNIFRNNRAGYETGSGYGTLNCMYTSNPMISGNLFEGNWLIAESNKYAAGAAIRCVFGSDAHIRNNIIRCNYIISDGNLSEGTAMYIHSSNPLVINNLIYDNFIEPSYSHGSGGAIFFYDSHAKLINNTIRANYAREGGALWFKLSSPEFHNNIIRGNEAASGEQQVFFDDDESDPDFYHNNIQGGKENFAFKYSSYTFTGAWQGNIDDDPKYIGGGDSKNYDFSLSFDSPCIDSGSLDYIDTVLLETYDIFGNDRIFGQTIDIGAIEAQLASPSGISVIVSSSNISLSWEAVSGALSYVIYSSEDPFGQFEQEAVVTTNSYQGSVSATRKFYYIRSKN